MARNKKEKFVVNPARKVIEGIRSDILNDIDKLCKSLQGKTCDDLVSVAKEAPDLAFLYYCGAAVEKLNEYSPDRMAPNAAREIRKWIGGIVGSFQVVREEYEATLKRQTEEIVEICEQVNEYARKQVTAERR